MEVLRQSSSYDRLINCLSNWMALMELCDDLLDRLQLYGHAQYLDIAHAQETLREHWRKTMPHEFSYTTAALDKTRSLLSSTASQAAQKLSGLLHTVGIVGTIHSQVIKYLFGFYFAHPAIFVGSIVAAVVLQVGSEKIEECQLVSEVDALCENLIVVTSNLRAHYTYASETLANSFTHQDVDGALRVREAVHRLIEGAAKDNTASLQRHFDKRDRLFEKLATEDLVLSIEAGTEGAAQDEWVNVKVVEDHFKEGRKH
jgi:hypothetical protein